MADAAAVEACFAPLPFALALVIYALLPLDQRMRCAEVCRGWRDALGEVITVAGEGESPARAAQLIVNSRAAR
jgi:hypothetical protein